MVKRGFSTVPTNLLEYAEAALNHFKNHGYKVYPEKRELGFPYIPTILCTRHSTTIILEISTHLLDSNKTNAWIGYAKSCTKDTRIAVCLHPMATVSGNDEISLRKTGMGLYIVQEDGSLIEKIPPRDLALQIELPQLDSLPHELKRLLGSAYEQFNRSQWREGFEDICQAFENEARKYLKEGIKSSRITIMGKTGPKNPTHKQVNKMTMGQLAKNFSNIQNQNSLDNQISKTLDQINKDRIGVVHYKSRVRTEKSLRANVGRHMWVIISVLKQMV